jgi:uncharacterized protein YihD (DUF1040 family)
MIKEFTWYLHEDYEHGEVIEVLAPKVGMSEKDLEALNVGIFAYEVGFNCTLDTVTGEVKIVSLA